MPSSKKIKDKTFNLYIEEIKAVLKDDGYPEDNVGNTKLTLLAQKINNPPTRIDYEGYRWAIQRFAESIPTLSLKEIKNLCNLIQLSKIPAAEYHEIYLEAFRKWTKKEANIEQRAEILRLICEAGLSVTPAFLNNEDEIKRKFPWHWIDAAVAPAWEDAIKETVKQLEAEKNVKPLLLRLPRWWDLKQDKDVFYNALTLLVSAIKSEEVMKIKNYLEFIGAPVNKISEICRSSTMLQDNDYLKGNSPVYQLLYPSRADSSQMTSRSSRRPLKEQRAHV